MIGRLMLTTLDLWEDRGRRHDVFLHCKCKSLSLDIMIDNDHGRWHDLCLCLYPSNCHQAVKNMVLEFLIRKIPFRIPEQKKAPDPGSATLVIQILNKTLWTRSTEFQIGQHITYEALIKSCSEVQCF
jgi:hypothetical protein